MEQRRACGIASTMFDCWEIVLTLFRRWETPTHAAPTGPTPQATPQGMDHPYGQPGQQQDLDIVTNQDGSQSIRHRDGTLEPYSGDRSLTGNIGNFAMNQLMGGKKKQSGG